MKVTQTKILLQRLIVIRKDHFPLRHTFRFVTNFAISVAVIKVITRHQHKADIYLDYLGKKSKHVQNYSKIVLRLKCIGAAVHRLILTEEQSARLMKMLKDHFTIADNAKSVLKWTHAKLNSICLIIYAILVLTESV